MGDELGDLLFATVNVARHLKIDPEAALRGATAKFRRRFQAVEVLAAARRGLDLAQMGVAGMDLLWEEIKAAEPLAKGAPAAPRPGPAERRRPVP